MRRWSSEVYGLGRPLSLPAMCSLSALTACQAAAACRNRRLPRKVVAEDIEKLTPLGPSYRNGMCGSGSPTCPSSGGAKSTQRALEGMCFRPKVSIGMARRAEQTKAELKWVAT